MATYQNVADLARFPLNDKDKVRFLDSTLHLYATQGMQQIIKHRPDLFVGQFATLPTLADAIGDTVQLGDQYIQTLADYVVARASTHSDEHVLSGRAKMYSDLFGGGLS